MDHRKAGVFHELLKFSSEQDPIASLDFHWREKTNKGLWRLLVVHPVIAWCCPLQPT